MIDDARAARRAWSVFAAFFLLLMVPRWCGTGMFVDGITYATIARNLVETVPLQPWHLHYTATVHPQFFEHPPLGIWLMAGAFAVFGDVPWAETVYAVIIAIAFVGAAVALWRAAVPGRLGSWAFCLAIFCCPMTAWALANNMLEVPMTLFCMLSLACLARAGRAPALAAPAWGAVAGACAVAAVMCKGPFALFLLAWPAVAYVAWPAQRRALLLSCLGAALPGVSAATAVLRDADAKAYLMTYLQRQVGASLLGDRETAAWRGVALARLLGELVLPCLAVAALAWRSGHRERFASASGAARRGTHAAATAWLILALAASLPVAISPKQSGWYVFQSLPLYMLALTIRFQAEFLRCQDAALAHVRLVPRLAVGMVCVACIIGACRLGHADKHKDFHRDLAQISAMPAYASVHVCPDALLANWGLHANMARRFRASLGTDAAARWRLVDNEATCAVPETCRAAGPEPGHARARYTLYDCEATP